MKQFWTVLKFELGNYFKNRGFVTATVLIAVIVAAVIIVPTMFMGGTETAKTEETGEAAVLAVATKTGS